VRNLLRFILKNNFYFLFIFIQFLSGYLIYRSNTYQSSVLWNTTEKVIAEYFGIRMKGLRYFMLDDINRSISTSYLSKMQCVFKAPEFPDNAQSLRTSKNKVHFEYYVSDVVDVTRQYQNNYITITGGKNHGFEKDMGVFSYSGIVGIIQDVSDNFSLVMSVLHLKFKVNCEIKKNGIYGMLQWDGSSPYYAELTDLPNHTKAVRGDTVVTGKLSGVFPQGIPVGVIETIERKQNEPFLTARIRLSAEWGKLHQVYVVKNNYLKEADSLKANSIKTKNRE
jgi:rod shape-determining protein MreC